MPDFGNGQISQLLRLILSSCGRYVRSSKAQSTNISISGLCRILEMDKPSFKTHTSMRR
jgi:hypothetical protein